jgi:hypothetical protein
VKKSKNSRTVLVPAVNEIPIWSDTPLYEDWLAALGRPDDDEAWAAYQEMVNNAD